MPIDALSVLCAQLTRDLLAIAKFLFSNVCMQIKLVNILTYVQILSYKNSVTIP